MLQNKIYQNFFLEIIKTFFTIVFGLSLIALTVRAVNFLDLIVDSGYPLTTYFLYSFLNLFGLAPKFIPLAFIISIIIFILKHINDREFIILWLSGVKKIQLVNLFILISTFIVAVYLIFSIFLTPLALNKSRQLLSNDNLNSFLPTIKSNQFSDTFKGFTYIAERKIDNEVKNIFLHDSGNNLKNFASNKNDISNVVIIAKKGIIKERKMFLFNGQIISSKENKIENELINFEQLDISLDNFVTSTIKKPKLQETSTYTLLGCFLIFKKDLSICKEDAKKEMVPLLIRRLILPFYIPVITLICSFLLLKNHKFYSNRITIFIYSFLILLFTELVIRYTGINNYLRLVYIFTPFILFFVLYFSLIFSFKNETKKS